MTLGHTECKNIYNKLLNIAKTIHLNNLNLIFGNATTLVGSNNLWKII